MPNSVYIHIPFCKSKCKYCSFISYTTEINDKYFDSLIEDIEYNYRMEPLKTLYFGGGTPSLIKIDQIEKIISKFKFTSDCEITFEMNPDDINIGYLKDLKNLGINRLSMGSQTFNDEILNFIGRRHNSADTIKAVETAKKTGFENISLDLIYGLPESQNYLQNDLNIIVDLGVQHISTYGLKIEPGSYFYNHLPANLPDDDEQADMYIKINQFLEENGYHRYEVSNFSKCGYESRHNLNYWNNSEYYGFGISAHGYVDGIRYSNFENFEDYFKNPIGFLTTHKVTVQEQLEEEIFLGFRKTEGINVNKINEKFLIDFNDKYKSVINKYFPKYIQKTQLGYNLTIEGILLSNNILSEFIA